MFERSTTHNGPQSRFIVFGPLVSFGHLSASRWAVIGLRRRYGFAARSETSTLMYSNRSFGNRRLFQDLPNDIFHSVALAFTDQALADGSVSQHGRGQSLDVVGNDEGPLIDQ